VRQNSFWILESLINKEQDLQEILDAMINIINGLGEYESCDIPAKESAYKILCQIVQKGFGFEQAKEIVDKNLKNRKF